MVTVHLVGGVDAFIEVPLNWPLSSAPLVLLSIKNSSSQSQNLTLPLVGRVKVYQFLPSLFLSIYLHGLPSIFYNIFFFF
jgi:hypothetical protein